MASCNTISSSKLATHNIPSGVIAEILAWLPLNTLVLFKTVCKDWYTLINSPFFHRLHSNKSLESNSLLNRSLLYTLPEINSLYIVDDVYQPSRLTELKLPEYTIGHNRFRDMVGSCNGLVCIKVWELFSLRVECFLICNPSTRTFKSIRPLWNKKEFLWDASCAFYYDSEDDDYRIVLTSGVWTESDRDVLIYSLKSDLWRLATTPNFTGRRQEFVESVVYGNKMLHFFVKGGGYIRIVQFDVCSEEWTDELRLPVQVKGSDFQQFSEVDGNMYLCHLNFASPTHSIDIWMMEEYVAKEDYSWRLMFNIPIDFGLHTLVAVSKDEHPRLLLLGPGVESCIWYDPQDGTQETFKLAGRELHDDSPQSRNNNDQTAVLCIASLVSIPGSSSTKLEEILD